MCAVPEAPEGVVVGVVEVALRARSATSSAGPAGKVFSSAVRSLMIAVAPRARLVAASWVRWEVRPLSPNRAPRGVRASVSPLL